MTFEELKTKALSLPYEPGVYIMRDKTDHVIYVGKAKKLKNRVSQYFQDTASHSPKTRMMVSKIHHFDVIVAASEFEALVLECSLIKRYLPKYNILLKDDKGYPFVRLNMKDPYPTITLVNRITDDGAEYYGPYGSRGVTFKVIETVKQALMLPTCDRQFIQNWGHGRPCLNYHMNQCSGWCAPGKTREQYLAVMEQARQLFQGKYKRVADDLRQEMLACAENLEFELAAKLRDRLNAVEALGQKQLVTAGALADTDVIGFAQTEAKACFAVLHFSGGNLLDKDYEILQIPDDPASAVSSLIKQYYLSRGFAPKRILLPFETEDMELFARLLEQQFGRKTKLLVPQRGDNVRMVELAVKNAFEEAQRITGKEEKLRGTVALLEKMLSVDSANRMESYDISNISGTDIVAGMVVFEDGKPKKNRYKRFKIEGLSDQDDYASMRQVILRRFARLKAGDAGFDERPDVLLMDGGAVHARTAEEALRELDLSIPVFGMVKDDRHRTRALVTPSGMEISIDGNPSVFALIGSIQEEVHRFAISYHRSLRSKRLRYSELDSIEGIGPKRKQELLKTFRSLQAMSAATLTELERVLPRDAAAHVYDHFHQNNRKEEESICESSAEKPEASS
ncbi:MAG: excinuclease ABC subunit UvrC [Firmicutes bacterium]|nr:excinuclease ABC subunit UvrC [Bacillota bacterium]